MSGIDDDELRAAFLEEARDAVDDLLRLRDELTRDRVEDAPRKVLDAYRNFHNLKGAARLVGLSRIESLAHAAEDLLRGHTKSGERPDAARMDLLAATARAVLAEAEGTAEPFALERLVESLRAAGASPAPGAPASPPVPPAEGHAEAHAETPRPDSAPAAADARAGAHVSPAAEAVDVRATAPDAFVDSTSARATDLVRVRASTLDRLIATTAELMTQVDRTEVRERTLTDLVERLSGVLRSGHALDADALRSIAHDLSTHALAGRHELQQQRTLARDLADEVRKARMLPLATAVSGYRRIVEDAAEGLGKRVRFEAEVDSISLDRSVLDGLRDPMMHLLRNAVDHGIEAPDHRVAAGKSREGTVVLTARAAGALVELTVHDDGRGFDARALVARAVERGTLSPTAAETWTDAQALELVFQPGVSTAAEVTRWSGRGIGLDVVRSRVRELGGDVLVYRRDGGGAEFRIVLPVDVVQTKGLLVRAGETVIALPMTHVERALRVPSRALQRTDGGTVWPRPDAPPLHLLWLSALIGETREKDGDVLTVVVVRDRDRALGFVVPEILGESDFVLRPLPWNLVRVPGIAGAAVLGDGRIALLLHLESFLAHGKDGARAYEPNAEVGARRMGRTVLVVDDSVTSRILLRNILSTAGYEVVVADDGEEAWDVLQRQPVDLVVTDVQMPRLDGHGLCRRIRKDPQTADLPVIMVTSLARPEDVTLGRQAGADEYVVKGRFDAKGLLEAVARLSA